MNCPFCYEPLEILCVETQAMAVTVEDPHYHDSNQKAMYLKCKNKHRFQFVGKIQCPGCDDLSWMDKIEERFKKDAAQKEEKK